jgi:hypothetical protein
MYANTTHETPLMPTDATLLTFLAADSQNALPRVSIGHAIYRPACLIASQNKMPRK